jgi:hypothetical protein
MVGSRQMRASEDRAQGADGLPVWTTCRRLACPPCSSDVRQRSSNTYAFALVGAGQPAAVFAERRIAAAVIHPHRKPTGPRLAHTRAHEGPCESEGTCGWAFCCELGYWDRHWRSLAAPQSQLPSCDLPVRERDGVRERRHPKWNPASSGSACGSAGWPTQVSIGGLGGRPCLIDAGKCRREDGTRGTARTAGLTTTSRR